MLPGDKGGMHADLYIAVLLFAYSQQLRGEAEFLAQAYIRAGYIGNALYIYFIYRHPRMERQAGENRELKGGVHAFYVQRGVGLSQAQALSVSQDGA